MKKKKCIPVLKKKTIQLCLGHYPLTAITLILIMKILILPSFMNNKKGRSWVEGKEMGSKELDERFCHVAKCTCMISRELWKCSSIFFVCLGMCIHMYIQVFKKYKHTHMTVVCECVNNKRM